MTVPIASSSSVKNIIIAVLALLCLVLAFFLFTKSTAAPDEPIAPDAFAQAYQASSSCLSKDTKKLDRSAIIRMADIEGISLSTKIEDVEGLAKKSGFVCQKTEPATDQITFTCKHGKLKDTGLIIAANAGKITQINRNGGMAQEAIAPMFNKIEEMKSLLNTRENVQFTQSADQFSFTVRNQTQNSEENLDYSIMRQMYRDDKKPEEFKTQLIYSAVLSVR